MFPASIQAGATTYDLVPGTTRYVVAGAPVTGALEWTCHADPKTKKLFFVNKVAKQTVWLLPDVRVSGAFTPPQPPSTYATVVSGESPAIIAVSTSAGATTSLPSAAEMARRNIEAQLAQKMKDRGLGGLAERMQRTATTSPAAPSAAGPAASPTTTAPQPVNSPPSSFASPSISETSAAAAAGSRSQVTANAAAAASSSSPNLVPVDVSGSALAGGAMQAASPARGSSASASSWKERLEQHRRSRSQSSEGGATTGSGGPTSAAVVAASPTPQRTDIASSIDAAASAPPQATFLPASPGVYHHPSRGFAEEAFTPIGASSPSLARSAATATSSSYAPPPVAAAGMPDALSDANQQRRNDLAVSAERALFEERRRVMVSADAQLQKERAELARQERLALERERALLEERQRHEEETNRIVESRRAMEQRRLELEQSAIDRLEEALSRRQQRRSDGFASSPSRRQQDDGGSSMYAARELGNVLSMAVAGDQSPLGFHGAGPLPGGTDNGDPGSPVVHIAELDDTVARWQEMESNNPNSRGGRTLKKATIQYAPTLSYTGTMNGKQKHGAGRYELDATGTTFHDGEWANDRKNGRGVTSLPHVLYEGDWLDDRPHGSGLLQTKELNASLGMARGLAHGKAVIQCRSGAAFAGRVHSNKLASPGALTLGNGATIEWLWGVTPEAVLEMKQRAAAAGSSGKSLELQEASNGSALALESSQQQALAGRMLAEARRLRRTDPVASLNDGDRSGGGSSAPGGDRGNGLAKVVYPDGDCYVGGLRGYQMHGQGRFFFAATGDEYVGEFHHGRMTGKGTYTFAPQAEGGEDDRDGRGMARRVDEGKSSSVYVGEFLDGGFHGRGTYRTPDTVYEGSWRAGKMHGQGRLKYLGNGDIWQGTFEDDVRISGKYVASNQFLI